MADYNAGCRVELLFVEWLNAIIYTGGPAAFVSAASRAQSASNVDLEQVALPMPRFGRAGDECSAAASRWVPLVHPGGPFWRNKDRNNWSIPKGEFGDDETAEAAAAREFEEETSSGLQRLPWQIISMPPIESEQILSP